MCEKPRVVCLLSASYSGSTVLSLLAAASLDVVSFGDTYGDPQLRCSCGSTLASCPIRTAIAERYAGAWQPLVTCDYASHLEQFVRAALDYTGATVYWDGSKSITRAALYVMAGWRPTIVHMVRGVGGFSESYERHHPGRLREGVRSWYGYNQAARDLGKDDRCKYVRIEPEEEFHRWSPRLLRSCGIESLDPGSVIPRELHLIGNTGVIDEWAGHVKPMPYQCVSEPALSCLCELRDRETSLQRLARFADQDRKKREE